MFSESSSLLSLPDISKWNINKVKNMSYMFYGCSSLTSLPDISKWNTNHAINMSYMFSQCLNIIISKKITKKYKNLLIIHILKKFRKILF